MNQTKCVQTCATGDQTKCVQTCATGEYLPVNQSVLYSRKSEPLITFCNEKKYMFNGDMADPGDLFCRKIHEYNFKFFNSTIIDTNFTQPIPYHSRRRLGNAVRLKATEKKNATLTRLAKKRFGSCRKRLKYYRLINARFRATDMYHIPSSSFSSSPALRAYPSSPPPPLQT